MYYPEEVIEEVNRINPTIIMDYFGFQYKISGIYYKMACPIHGGKDKNFKINRETYRWACFSHACVKNSNNIGFIMEYKEMTFPQAIQLLASIAGIDIEGVSSIEAKRMKIQSKLKRNYKKDSKKIDSKPVERKQCIFNVPENNGYDHPMLVEKELEKGTLKDFGVYYNKKMNRIVFLIKDHDDNIVGYKARATTPEQEKTKKFDSPYNYVVNTLYGIWITAPFIIQKKEIILIEGQWDVMKLFENGIYNVAGTMGNSLLETQAQWIKDNGILKVKIAPDKDKPGDRLLLKAYELLGDSVEIEIIDYPSFSIEVDDKEFFSSIVQIPLKDEEIEEFGLQGISRCRVNFDNRYSDNDFEGCYAFLDIDKNSNIDLIEFYMLDKNNDKFNSSSNIGDIKRYKDPDSLPNYILKSVFL